MSTNILFVCSGNSSAGISPIIKNQGESIVNQGSNVSYFTIKGKGFWSYFQHIFILRKFLQNNYFDIIHAHYSLSAFVASLAGAKPLVVSLMGSDVKSNNITKQIIYIFNYLFKWGKVIVKSQDMRNGIKLRNLCIIPNGVDLEHFHPYDKLASQGKLGWDSSKKHILFAANPARPVKNFKLALDAYALLDDNDCEMHVFDNVPHGDIPDWINASDLVMLTSLWEGSPNVIKEAMACNRPIVSTDVGDVSWLFGNTEGHFITGFKPLEVTEKIKLALEFSKIYGSTRGLERIQALGLSSEQVAMKILSLYDNVLNR